MLNNPAILDRVMSAKRGRFSFDVAREILKLTFPAKDIERYQKLAYKAQDGRLTKKERGELEDYVNVNDFLMILRAKAEASLRKRNPAV